MAQLNFNKKSTKSNHTAVKSKSITVAKNSRFFHWHFPTFHLIWKQKGKNPSYFSARLAEKSIWANIASANANDPYMCWWHLILNASSGNACIIKKKCFDNNSWACHIVLQIFTISQYIWCHLGVNILFECLLSLLSAWNFTCGLWSESMKLYSSYISEDIENKIILVLIAYPPQTPEMTFSASLTCKKSSFHADFWVYLVIKLWRGEKFSKMTC